MRSWMIAFLAGIIGFQLVSSSPHHFWVLLALPGALLARRYSYWRLPFACLGGFCIALLSADSVLEASLPASLRGEPIQITASIDTLIEPRHGGVRFEVEIGEIVSPAHTLEQVTRARLFWRDPPLLPSIGERWVLCVRVDYPHSWRNPGGFDYEGWMFQQGLALSGYVVACPANRRVESVQTVVSLAHWRDGIRQRLTRVGAGLSMIGILQALIMGDRSGISDTQWDVLVRTGTSHLMAISGLHIGLVFTLVSGVGLMLWRLSARRQQVLPQRIIAGGLGLLVAMLYAGLAGFAIPTQRALLMLVLAYVGYCVMRPLRTSNVLLSALILILLWQPRSVLAVGSWLSFVAVALIAYGFQGRYQRLGGVRAMLHLQWLMLLGTAPLLLAVFQQMSLVTVVTNLLAVPLVSLVVVPLALAGTAVLFVSEPFAWGLLSLANGVLSWVWRGLEYAASQPYAIWEAGQLPTALLGLAALGVLLLLAPRGVAGRTMGLVMLMPALLYTPERPPMGGWRMDVLDVGQGLAVVLRTHEHTLVYDTGNRFRSGSDAGEAVITPYLKSQGIDRTDMLVVSHGDSDHIGGAAGLLQRHDPASLLTSVPATFAGLGVQRCQQGMQWQWDAVGFQILHPSEPRGTDSDNNQSCVLKVSAAGASVLLTGDIESEAEYQLLTQQRTQLRADVLIAPHHGSDTSSTPGFVQAVAPRHVVISAGHRNRYRQPADIVLARYRAIDAKIWQTARHGSVRIEFDPIDGLTVTSYHDQSRRYWHRPRS